MLPILKNELRNKGKSMYGKRYSDDLKKFAATLHYHSPKAYAYCRLAPFLLFLPSEKRPIESTSN